MKFINSPFRVVFIGLIALAATTAHAQNIWMGRLDGTKLISDFSIPGTHDSGTYRAVFDIQAQAQSRTFQQQLDDGVRFFDVRLARVEATRFTPLALLVAHGPITSSSTVHDVFQTFVNFVAAHPTETVIMSVKHEWGSTLNFDGMVYAEISRNLGRYWLNDYIPTLNAVRGKIVLVRRFAHSGSPTALGMNATTWPDNTTFAIRNMDIEDLYDGPQVDVKLQAIRSHLNKADLTAVGHYVGSTFVAKNSSLFLTFTSAYGNFFSSPITGYSTPINQQIGPVVQSYGHTRLGIIIMDFVTPALASVVINSN